MNRVNEAILAQRTTSAGPRRAVSWPVSAVRRNREVIAVADRKSPYKNRT
jgi:hypothetical protein